MLFTSTNIYIYIRIKSLNIYVVKNYIFKSTVFLLFIVWLIPQGFSEASVFDFNNGWSALDSEKPDLYFRDVVTYWPGVWIVTPEPDGWDWPEGVVACWNMTGICMIEVIATHAPHKYGIDNNDLPAVIIDDGKNTVFYRTRVAKSKRIDNDVTLYFLESQ